MGYTKSSTQGNDAMQLKSAKHKGLKAMLAGDDRPKGLNKREAELIRIRLTVLEAAPDLPTVTRSYPGWRLHFYKGGPWAGNWAIDVTGNWRLIFRMAQPGVITELDYADTH